MSSDLDELWHRWNDGGRTERDLNDLATAAKPLIRTVVRSVRAGSEHERDDLEADGNFGFLQAVQAFDPERGVLLVTYATRRILSAVRDGMRGKDRLPKRRRAAAEAVNQATAALAQKHGRAPLDSEVAGHLGWTEQAVHEARLDALAAAAPASSDGTEADGRVGDAAWAYDQLRLRIAWALNQLDGADRAVIVLYYLEGLTMSEVADVLGVSTTIVSRKRDRAAQQIMDLLRSR